MTETSSRLLELLSLLQARRDWPGAELADRLEVSRPDDPARRRAAARARLPGRVAHRPGRRLPASRRDRDAAAAARRRRGDRDRGRPAHRRPRLGDRHRGDRGAGAGQARAGPAGAPAPPRRRARVGDDRAPGRRPDGRPAAPDRDRRGLPRLRVPALRLPKPRRHRQPPRGRAPLARQPRPPLVPRRLGPPPRGLAHLPRRPAGQAGLDRRALHAAQAAGARTPPRTSSRASPGRRTASRRASRCTPPRRRSRAASRPTGARSSRSTRTPASTGPATTTSGGWRCASRCSASTSRSTSRRSWSSSCGRWRSGSSAAPR